MNQWRFFFYLSRFRCTNSCCGASKEHVFGVKIDLSKCITWTLTLTLCRKVEARGSLFWTHFSCFHVLQAALLIFLFSYKKKMAAIFQIKVKSKFCDTRISTMCSLVSACVSRAKWKSEIPFTDIRGEGRMIKYISRVIFIKYLCTLIVIW